jgi:hypothetical protein
MIQAAWNNLKLVISNTDVSISHIPGEHDDKVDFRRKANKNEKIRRNFRNTS